MGMFQESQLGFEFIQSNIRNFFRKPILKNGKIYALVFY